MMPSATGPTGRSSSPSRAWIGVFAPFAPFALVACGWRFGGGPAAPPLDAVVGGTVEPGLRSAIEQRWAAYSGSRGSVEGDPVEVEVVSVGQRPEAIGTGEQVWVTEIDLRAVRGDRCLAEVQGRRSWTLPTDDPLAAQRARDAAVSALVSEVTPRLVDGVAGGAGCR